VVRARTLKHGLICRLSKPFGEARLLARVNSALHQSKPNRMLL
jgi:hypothetical protein